MPKVETAPLHTPPVLQDFVRFGKKTTEFPLPVEAAAAEFDRYNAIAISNFLSPEMLAVAMSMSARAHWSSFTQREGHIEVENPRHTGNVLRLLMNRNEYLHWLERVTGCGELKEITGELFQIRPAPGDQLLWHDDLIVKDRRLAMVIYLGAAPHEGGEFELRVKEGPVLFQYKHLVPGSAVIFRIHPTLAHRVQPISSGGPRRVFSAWALAPSQTHPFGPVSGDAAKAVVALYGARANAPRVAID